MSVGALQWLPDGWEADAACLGADLNLFYAPNYFERRLVKVAREAKAKTFCRACPVLERCREYALESGEDHGVWGGLNEMERRRIRRRRAAVGAELSAVGGVQESGAG